jgi:hypothetical protein
MLHKQSEVCVVGHIPTAEEKWELVKRVGDSQTFQKSIRLREFFLYAADCTLSNRPEDVREQQIAQNVFHRKPDYNSAQDNIVRVEARLLRKRLERYFASEGHDGPLLITMPKGSYVLNFEARSTDSFEAEPELPVNPTARIAGDRVDEHPKDSMALLPQTIAPRTLSWPFWVPLMIVVAVTASAATFFIARGSNQAVSKIVRQLPLAAIIDAGKDVDIVTADTSLVVLQELVKRTISLDEYIDHRYPPVANPLNLALFEHMERRKYTDSNEVALASRIALQNSRYSGRIFVRSARDVDLTQLKERNVILLGTPASNPWSQLYYEDLPFQFDSTQRGVVLNLKPRAGEEARYVSTTRSGETGDTNGLVAFIPNLGEGGYALLIAGTTAEGTAAAGDFVLDEAKMAEAYKTMGIDRTGAPSFFMLLLKARTFPGSSKQTTIQAWRLIGHSARQTK